MFPHKSDSAIQKLCDQYKNINDIVDVLLNEGSNHDMFVWFQQRTKQLCSK